MTIRSKITNCLPTAGIVVYLENFAYLCRRKVLKSQKGQKYAKRIEGTKFTLMNIALIGYGKMGHCIEEVALERGHRVVCIIDKDNTQDFDSEAFAAADVAIEFTTPSTAEENIRRAWSKGKPVVCGTTGWQWTMNDEQLTNNIQDKHNDEPNPIKQENENALIWSSNFSLGVNILFALDKRLADIMQRYPQYTPSITEIHHVHKLDAPSGTAKTLSQLIINQEPLTCRTADTDTHSNGTISLWNNVPITSIREGEVAGIHTVQWESEEDILSIRHEAKSRKGFALGAILAAEWIIGKTGFHTMEEVLNL